MANNETAVEALVVSKSNHELLTQIAKKQDNVVASLHSLDARVVKIETARAITRAWCAGLWALVVVVVGSSIAIFAQIKGLK